MARMIPAVIDPVRSPPGEVELFGLLQRDAPADWIVLHSVDLPHHVRQIEGELDFLVLIPGVAAICLEVKSHQRVIRDASRLWRLGNDQPALRSPFRQAAEAMHSTRKQLSERRELDGVVFTSAVAFPRCRFEVPATEWEPWQVFDESALTLHGITDVLNRIGASARSKLAEAATASWFRAELHEPTAEQCSTIVATLRPRFEQSRSPKARRAEADGEIRRYTAEQFDALDELDANPRVVFSGAAGTGKTFIAIEAARRAAVQGDRVLFCCYNRLLGKWLQRESAPLGEHVTCGSLHSIMRSIADVPVPHDPSPTFWSDELPARAIEALLDDHQHAGSYDLVVVDEAQDICTTAYLDVVDLLARDGLSGGRLLAFGDFEHQSIYTDVDSRALLIARSNASTFKLKENCRNRPRIGFIATRSFGRDPYRKYRRPDDGIEVVIRTYAGPDEQSEVVCELIDSARADGYQLGDIAILAPVAQQPAWEGLPSKHRAWCVDAGQTSSAKIRTSTIHAFKGLEAAAVIVTDLEDLVSVQARQLLYVAATRATDRLALCVHRTAIPQLETLLTGGQQ